MGNVGRRTHGHTLALRGTGGTVRIVRARHHHTVRVVAALNARHHHPLCRHAITTPARRRHALRSQLKNQVQASAAGVPANASALERARYVIKHRGGVLGLYRGIGPGLSRSLIANGSSMVVFNACQNAMRRRGEQEESVRLA